MIGRAYYAAGNSCTTFSYQSMEVWSNAGINSSKELINKVFCRVVGIALMTGSDLSALNEYMQQQHQHQQRQSTYGTRIRWESLSKINY